MSFNHYYFSYLFNSYLLHHLVFYLLAFLYSTTGLDCHTTSRFCPVPFYTISPSACSWWPFGDRHRTGRPDTATVSLVKIKGHFYYTQNPSANISLGEVDVALERDPRFWKSRSLKSESYPTSPDTTNPGLLITRQDFWHPRRPFPEGHRMVTLVMFNSKDHLVLWIVNWKCTKRGYCFSFRALKRVWTGWRWLLFLLNGISLDQRKNRLHSLYRERSVILFECMMTIHILSIIGFCGVILGLKINLKIMFIWRLNFGWQLDTFDIRASIYKLCQQFLFPPSFF